MEIELIADYECDIGENPLWHPQEQSVYWTDIDRGKIFCFDTKTAIWFILRTNKMDKETLLKYIKYIPITKIIDDLFLISDKSIS